MAFEVKGVVPAISAYTIPEISMELTNTQCGAASALSVPESTQLEQVILLVEDWESVTSRLSTDWAAPVTSNVNLVPGLEETRLIRSVESRPSKVNVFEIV